MDDTDQQPQTTLVVVNTCTAVSPYNFKADTDCTNEERHALHVQNFMASLQIQTILERISDLDELDCLPLALVPYSPIGYVYAAWNPLFPDLIKIGATMRQSPYTRVKELSTSGVPEPFQLVAYVSSKDPFALEKRIHAHYDHVRKFGRKKEFFMIARDEAVEYYNTKSVEIACMIEQLTQNQFSKLPTKRKHTSPNTRKHIKVFCSETDKRNFQDSLKEFIQAHLVLSPSSRAFVRTSAIIKKFKSVSPSSASDILISKEVKTMIQSFNFPPTVQRTQHKRTMGYTGLELK